MKNYEKLKQTTLLILLTTMLSFYSCSGDSEGLIKDETKEENFNDFKFLTHAIEDGGGIWGEETKISYDGDLMIKFDGGLGVYTFEYNDFNKVNFAKKNNGKSIEFVYLNTRLNKIIDEYESENVYSYDNRGNIISVLNGFEDSYYTYDSNGTLLNLKLIGDDGKTELDYSFEFDDKTNPFYPIWKQYGYIEDLEFSPYDIIPMFCENNPTKIYRGNQLRLEANYNYDGKGYPISCNFTYYQTNGSTSEGNILFEYLN